MRLFDLVAGMGFEPHDLRVMSPTSYRTALPRDIHLLLQMEHADYIMQIYKCQQVFQRGRYFFSALEGVRRGSSLAFWPGFVIE